MRYLRSHCQVQGHTGLTPSVSLRDGQFLILHLDSQPVIHSCSYVDCGGVHSHHFAHECPPVLAPLTEKTVCPPSNGFCKLSEGLTIHQHKDCVQNSHLLLLNYVSWCQACTVLILFPLKSLNLEMWVIWLCLLGSVWILGAPCVSKWILESTRFHVNHGDIWWLDYTTPGNVKDSARGLVWASSVHQKAPLNTQFHFLFLTLSPPYSCICPFSCYSLSYERHCSRAP